MNRLIHMLAIFAAAVLVVAHLADRRTPDVRPDVEQAQAGDRLFYDVEVRSPEGELISRPRVLGEAGRPTRVELWDEPVSREAPQDLRMCIVLDAVGAKNGLDMAIDLTVDGLVEAHRSRVRMPMGQPQVIKVPTDDGRTLDVTLLAYRVGSPAFEAYVKSLEGRVSGAHGRPPEA